MRFSSGGGQFLFLGHTARCSGHSEITSGGLRLLYRMPGIEPGKLGRFCGRVSVVAADCCDFRQKEVCQPHSKKA